MAFCANCGQELDVNAKYCVNCGEANTKHPQQQEQRKTVYDGTMHKCPNCGGNLNSFDAVCSGCGYELRDININSLVHNLSLELKKAKSSDEKIELISNFYIPNTKEEIYEFFILAYSNISAGVYEVDAWIAKLEQAYLKAKFTFGQDSEFDYIQKLYDKVKKSSNRKLVINHQTLKPLVIFMFGFILLLVGFILSFLTNDEDLFVLFLFLGFVPFVTGMIMFIIIEFKKILKK